MSELNKVVKLKTSKNKVAQYKQQSDITFQLLVKSQQQEAKQNMQHLLSYPLTRVGPPYSIATADGFLRYIFSTKPAIKRHILGIVDCWWGVPQSNGKNKNKYKYILFAFLIKIDF